MNRKIKVTSRVAPDIRLAGYPAFFGIRYPAGYPAGRIPDIRPDIRLYRIHRICRSEMMSIVIGSKAHISKNIYFIDFETEEN